MNIFKVRTVKLFGAATIFFTVLLTSCNRNDETEEPKQEVSFDITKHFIGGTITQNTGSKYSSVFFIEFLEDNKALFINSSSTNLVGNYTLTQDSLIFKVTGGNARTAKFALDKNKKITYSYYTAHTSLTYEAKGELLPVSETNELAGKSFKGEEFKMGEVSNRPGLIFKFNTMGTNTYGSGTNASTIDNTSSSYTLIGGRGFKSVNGNTTELGFLSDKVLTVFKVSGLYYYGKYDQQ